MPPIRCPPNAPARQLVTDPDLSATLQDYLSQLDGNYGIAVENLVDGRSVLIHSDQPSPTASMYKLLVMYRAFEKDQQGEISMDDTITIIGDDMASAGPDEAPGVGSQLTVAEALHAMITYSSNSAAWALARHMGGWGEVFAAANELGMGLSAQDEGFVSSPADMLHFFELLYDQRLVSAEASQQMMQLLLGQTINDRIPALLPSEVPVAHKTGDLEEVRNDGGIVLASGSDYIIVIMANNVNPVQAVQAESLISKMVYDRYGTSNG
ncbi:MAG TPA: serine hydrolase [Chloroflexota bacterium]|nr:serine hydrolase [Chloroflexota bacterium]